MRFVWAGLAAFMLSSAALAQAPEPPMLNWVKRPTGNDFAKHYPVKAAERGISGASALCCVVREDGSLDCRSAAEAPAGLGFGAAAVKISRAFRISKADAIALRGRTARLEIPLTFRMYGDGPKVEAALAAFQQANKGICEKRSNDGLSTPIAALTSKPKIKG